MGDDIEHENLLSVREAFEYRGRYYIILPLQDGSLLQLLNRSSLPAIEWVAPVARDVLRGLAHLHGLGLVHSDLHIENVLYSTHGTPCPTAAIFKLSDLGLAVRWDPLPDGSEDPKLIDEDVRAASRLLLEVATHPHTFFDDDSQLAATRPSLALVLRRGLRRPRPHYVGEHAAAQLLSDILRAVE